MTAEACQREQWGSGTPREWPRRPKRWNGNGRRQTAKQTLGEQLWVTYILWRNHADGLQGVLSTARRLLEPEMWPGACGISQSQWLLMDINLITQCYYCDMTDHSPLLEVVMWNQNTQNQGTKKKKSWDFNQLGTWNGQSEKENNHSPQLNFRDL